MSHCWIQAFNMGVPPLLKMPMLIPSLVLLAVSLYSIKHYMQPHSWHTQAASPLPSLWSSWLSFSLPNSYLSSKAHSPSQHQSFPQTLRNVAFSGFPPTSAHLCPNLPFTNPVTIMPVAACCPSLGISPFIYKRGSHKHPLGSLKRSECLDFPLETQVKQWKYWSTWRGYIFVQQWRNSKIAI